MIGRDFITAGRAIFTVSNPKGEHYTFKVTPSRSQDYFLAFLLVGSDNTNYNHYAYLCKIRRYDLAAVATKEIHTSVRVLSWVLKLILKGESPPEGYKVQPSERCGRCGRLLTTPESIESGLGPECRKVK